MPKSAKLIVVVPDGSYEKVLEALFQRSDDLQIGPVEPLIRPDPYHDSSGQLTELLRPFIRDYSHALVLRDFEGSGFPNASVLQAELEKQMHANGWGSKKHAAIIVEPEIEDWLRLPSPQILQLLRDRARRQKGKITELNIILAKIITGHGGRDPRGKVKRPKEVFQDLVGYYGIPRSNALYGYLAKREDLTGCLSPSFNKLLEILRSWFPN